MSDSGPGRSVQRMLWDHMQAGHRGVRSLQQEGIYLNRNPENIMLLTCALEKPSVAQNSDHDR